MDRLCLQLLLLPILLLVISLFHLYLGLTLLCQAHQVHRQAMDIHQIARRQAHQAHIHQMARHQAHQVHRQSFDSQVQH